jgi:phosphopantetheinyl transferase
MTFLRQSEVFDFGLCHLLFDTRHTEKYIKEFLNSEEIISFNSFKFTQKKESYLFGRVCAKMAILQLFPEKIPTSIFISSGIFSFPIVQNMPGKRIDVSISHSYHNAVSVAYFSEHPMGIDTEVLDVSKLDLLNSKLSQNEIRSFDVLSFSNLEAWTIAWTIKEALSKILRTGLTFDFNKIEITSIKKMGNIICAEFADFQQYKSMSFLGKERVFSMVCPKNSEVDFTHLEKFLVQTSMI